MKFSQLVIFQMKIFCCLLITGWSQGEVFTAMTDVSQLLKTEGEMIRTVENYIIAQEERLGKLRR